MDKAILQGMQRSWNEQYSNEPWFYANGFTLYQSLNLLSVHFRSFPAIYWFTLGEIPDIYHWKFSRRIECCQFDKICFKKSYFIKIVAKCGLSFTVPYFRYLSSPLLWLIDYDSLFFETFINKLIIKCQ